MSKDKWSEVKEVLKGSMTRDAYDQHFSRSEAVRDGDGLSISLGQNANLEAIKNQLHKVVIDSVKPIYGDMAISYQEQQEQSESEDTFKIEDERPRPHFFQTDDNLFKDGHASSMKPFAFSVYQCLAMHAGKDSHEAWQI